MKFLFVILLFSFIFGNIISNADFKKRPKKNIFNKNNKIQKLISKANPIKSQKNKEINSSKRILEENTKEIDNKIAKVQIIKFYNYTNDTKNKKIEFNILYYFFSDQKIPIQTKFNTIITPENNKILAEDTDAKCDLINKDFEGKLGFGNITSYRCAANVTIDMIKRVKINTSIPMELIYKEIKNNKKIDFKNITFNGNSAQESDNIQENTINSKDLVELTDVQFVKYYRNYFIINCRIDSPYKIPNNETISMSFINITKNQTDCKEYNCTYKIRTNQNLIDLECDTENNPINTTIKYLHLSSGIYLGDIILVIKMKDVNDLQIELPIKNESKFNITADYPPFDIDENPQISNESKKIDFNGAPLQIVKFYNYTYEENVSSIKFISDFYFYGKKIAKDIIFRLNVFYNNINLRRLDLAESIQSKCSIRDEDINMTYLIGMGKIYDYTCQATPNRNLEIKNVSINTDIPMIFVGIDNTESIDFRYINFNGNSSKESQNLNEIRNITNKVELKKAQIFIVNRNYFQIGGVLNNNETIKDNETFEMVFTNNTKDEKKLCKYNCTASIKLDGVTTVLTCDTEKYPINTTLKDIHLSTGISMKNNNNLITLKMKNWNNSDTKIDSITSGKSTRKYHPDSGGLSAGAIVGIIISIVVVLAAVVIIILVVIRKPTPAPEKNINNSSVNKFESTDKL